MVGNPGGDSSRGGGPSHIGHRGDRDGIDGFRLAESGLGGGEGRGLVEDIRYLADRDLLHGARGADVHIRRDAQDRQARGDGSGLVGGIERVVIGKHEVPFWGVVQRGGPILHGLDLRDEVRVVLREIMKGDRICKAECVGERRR